MEAVAIDHEVEGVFEATGTVTAVLEDGVGVCSGDGAFRASRAVSCLVTPEVGDVVLLVGSRLGRVYVLAVLERPGSRDARISTSGHLTVELRSGRFAVAATEGVDLISKRTVAVSADRLETTAREGRLLLGSVTLIAGVVDATLERLSQAARCIYRRVQDLEHVRAGQIDYAAEGNVRLHGQNTLMTARELVKADGGQIHIG